MAKRVYASTSALVSKSTLALAPALILFAAVAVRADTKVKVGAAAPAAGVQRAFASLSDFSGAKIAHEAGTVFAQFVDRVIPGVEHVYYANVMDAVEAVKTDRADAVSADMPIALYMTARNPNLVVFPYVVAEDRYGFAVAKGSQLGVKGNRVLKKFKEDGLIGELEALWFSADESKKRLPKLNHKRDFDGSAGTIKFGYQEIDVPSVTYGPSSFDLDIVTRIAYELNMKMEPFPVPTFDVLLPMLASGKVNMVGGSMSITAERQKAVDFVGPYFEGGTTLIIKRDRLGMWRGR